MYDIFRNIYQIQITSSGTETFVIARGDKFFYTVESQ